MATSNVNTVMKIKTLKLLNTNLLNLNNHEEVIKYQMLLLQILSSESQDE
jgi:hypothetical protein